MSTKILITGAGGPAAVAVIKALHAEDVQFFAADIDPYAAGLYLVPAAQRLILLPGSRPDFTPHLLALCNLHQIDVLIPTVDCELLPISKDRDQFERLGVRVMLAPQMTLRRTLDKFILAQVCKEKIHVPRTELFNQEFVVDDWEFPVIVKPRSGSGSRGVIQVNSPEELATIEHNDQLIIQEFLPGAEFSVDVFADHHGTIGVTVPRERLKIDSGVAVTSRSVHHPQLEKYARLVAFEVGLTGVGNIQFRMNKNGQPFLLEVNPRFSGTMPLTVASGANIPLLCLKEIMGEPISASELEWSELAMTRTWQETFFPSSEIESMCEQKQQLIEITNTDSEENLSFMLATTGM